MNALANFRFHAGDVFLRGLAQFVPGLLLGVPVWVWLPSVWIQVVSGELEVAGVSLRDGDGLAVTDPRELQLNTKSPVEALVFDLSGMTRIDSTGIGRFIDTYGRLRQSGGQMRLAGAAGTVRDAFRLTRLDTVFSFYPTVKAACEGWVGETTTG